tara:strand:- start:605 stop:1546 length:942 start_codon:yes stop_codon:yes gene_type:complete
MTNKEKYKHFCLKAPIPIFSQDWWLDSVCINGEWDVALIEKGGVVVASMPYYIKKKGPFKLITMPPLTQTMGPYIKYPEGQKYAKKLAYEKELMTNLIDQLPNVDYFCQNFHSTITNWLPFYWRGFEQSTRYTYVLKNTSFEMNSFQSNIKTDIKKALKMVEIQSVDSVNEIWHCLTKTFERQNKKPPYSKDFLENLEKQVKRKESSIKLVATDKDNYIHAAIYLVHLNSTVYYLIGGGDPKYRNSGATSLLINKALDMAKDNQWDFDFEGSMIEPIERFFRAFGAIQTPYFQIKKVNSKLLKCREFLRELKQ